MKKKSIPTESPLFIRVLKARSRLVTSVAFAIFLGIFIPKDWIPQGITRSILSWDVGAMIYLLFTFRMMFGFRQEKIEARAKAQDEGRILILILVIVSAIVTLGAIIHELALTKDLQGAQRYPHIALAISTILISWFFTHIMFAQHYAHDYYLAESEGEKGGLDFPGTDKPDYLDFFYFACIIGTSGQTADVAFVSATMRRTGLVHCVLAFFFNTTLLALTINIASGLF